MLFNTNDIEDQLNFNGNNQSGSYNQLQWSISPGNDSTDIISRIISIHEFLHNELNNITGYGFLLQAYAYLSREESQKKQFYKDVLRDLIGRCKLAHEAYATWIGITVFKNNIHDDLHVSVLENRDEYQYYYSCAEHMVEEFKSLFLKQQVVSASIRFCFQSSEIASYGIQHLEDFSFAALKNMEFPDSRFLYLLEKLPANFFKDSINEFIKNVTVAKEQSLLRDALNGNEDSIELLKIENNHLALGLMNKIYSKLQKHFDQINSPSLEDKEHMNYFENLLKQLDLICPLANSKNPLVLNVAPDDFDRNMVLNFENETLMLSEAPLPCVILQADDMSETTILELLKGIGADPHLFIMGRNSLFLENQYQFKYDEDKEWFKNLKGPFTAIRYAGLIDGQRAVFIIPFATPEKLIALLKTKTADFPVLGCISISASFHVDWWKLWGDFFVEHCTFACLLTDVSPLYYIERIFPGKENISYSKIIIVANSITYTAMLFQVKEKEIVQILMLVPGSDMYCQVLHHYIKSRFPSFVNDTILTKDQGKYIPIILSHLVREEHTYYYRSQNLNFI
jgi:hypothetical protein